MFFGDFLDFSTIFFLEFLTSFTHQNGYNLLQFICNLFFFVYNGWRDEVTHNKSPRKVYGFTFDI